MPIWATRCRILSLLMPAIARPATSPFTSAMNTGTPRREKPSAITISEIVLPVPVAPATRPCRLPYLGSRWTGRSPFPMSMSSTPGPFLEPRLGPRRPAAHTSVRSAAAHPSAPIGSRYARATLVTQRRRRHASRIMARPWGRCDVSENADRDDRRDARSWLDALTKKEEQKLIELLRQRYPERGDDRRRKKE